MPTPFGLITSDTDLEAWLQARVSVIAGPKGDTGSPGPAASSILTPRGLHAANLTTVTALTSGLTLFEYLGRAPSALTTCNVIFQVATAATGAITWAEVAIFKGSPVANGNASLTRVGFTSIAANVNSTGIKNIAVALSNVAAGDDLWIAFGGASATQQFQLRGMLADVLQSGVVQTASVRPSLASTPQAVTLAGAALVPAWCSVKV